MSAFLMVEFLRLLFDVLIIIYGYSCSASLLIGYLRVLVQKVGGSANLVTACAVGFAQEILSFWCKTFGLGCW